MELFRPTRGYFQLHGVLRQRETRYNQNGATSANTGQFWFHTCIKADIHGKQTLPKGKISQHTPMFFVFFWWFGGAVAKGTPPFLATF